MMAEFNRNQLSGSITSNPVDFSFLDDLHAEDTVVVVSDKFKAQAKETFKDGVFVDPNGNKSRLADNWEDLISDLNEQGFQL